MISISPPVIKQGQSEQVEGTSNIANTSGNWADMADMSITITTKGGNVLLLFSATFNIAHDEETDTRFDIDGSPINPISDRGIGATTEDLSITMFWLEKPCSAGSHTFKVQWKDKEGDAAQLGATFPRNFMAVELPFL